MNELFGPDIRSLIPYINLVKYYKQRDNKLYKIITVPTIYTINGEKVKGNSKITNLKG